MIYGVMMIVPRTTGMSLPLKIFEMQLLDVIILTLIFRIVGLLNYQSNKMLGWDSVLRMG